jgi:energy-coupling factor transporter transmembrane protein EcfT
MELNPIDHPDTPTGHSQVVPSIILYICSWLFIGLADASADDIWKWSWRTLSGISLLLIIYINWNKAKEIFKSKKSKNKKV